MKIDNHDLIIKQFHNQKTPDFDPETGHVYTAGSKGYVSYHKYLDSLARDKEFGDKSEMANHLKNLIKQIENIRLKKGSENDQEQIDQLIHLKKRAFKNLSILLEDVKNYINSIKIMETTENIDPASLDYDAKLKAKLDDERSRKHDILIDRINAAMRYISHAFGNISEDEIDKWEDENDIIANVQRIDLPEKIIFTRKINYTNREHITAWAVQLYDELTKIKKELSESDQAL